MAEEFPLPLLIIILPGTTLPREAAVLPRPVMAPDSLVCPAQSLERPPLTITSSPSATQEAKWAAAHRLTMSPGTKGTSPDRRAQHAS